MRIVYIVQICRQTKSNQQNAKKIREFVLWHLEIDAIIFEKVQFSFNFSPLILLNLTQIPQIVDFREIPHNFYRRWLTFTTFHTFFFSQSPQIQTTDHINIDQPKSTGNARWNQRRATQTRESPQPNSCRNECGLRFKKARRTTMGSEPYHYTIEGRLTHFISALCLTHFFVLAFVIF